MRQAWQNPIVLSAFIMLLNKWKIKDYYETWSSVGF